MRLWYYVGAPHGVSNRVRAESNPEQSLFVSVRKAAHVYSEEAHKHLAKKEPPAKKQRQSAPARSVSPAVSPRDTGPMKAQALMTQSVAAGMQFNGTLHRANTGPLTESFLRAAGLADQLLLRNANTLGAQIQAATNFFAANAEGDAISVDGVQITLGTSSGILF